jgi:hypothetical protein
MRWTLLLLPCCALSSLVAQTPIYAPFPDYETWMANYGVQEPGCACGKTNNLPIYIDPTAITSAPVNSDIKLRYDASGICQGQSIKDAKGNIYRSASFIAGTVLWEPGVELNLPDVFGIVTLPGGFNQVTNYSIAFKISVQCYDNAVSTTPRRPCSNTCSVSATIPVTISAATANLKTRSTHVKQQPHHQKLTLDPKSGAWSPQTK